LAVVRLKRNPAVLEMYAFVEAQELGLYPPKTVLLDVLIKTMVGPWLSQSAWKVVELAPFTDFLYKRVPDGVVNCPLSQVANCALSPELAKREPGATCAVTAKACIRKNKITPR
jgi:hypothetical protein